MLENLESEWSFLDQQYDDEQERLNSILLVKENKKTYSREFKIEAVKLSHTSEKNVEEVVLVDTGDN